MTSKTLCYLPQKRKPCRIFQCPYLIPVQEQFLDIESQEIHEHLFSKTDVQKLGWMHCPIE